MATEVAIIAMQNEFEKIDQRPSFVAGVALGVALPRTPLICSSRKRLRMVQKRIAGMPCSKDGKDVRLTSSGRRRREE